MIIPQMVDYILLVGNWRPRCFGTALGVVVGLAIADLAAAIGLGTDIVGLVGLVVGVAGFGVAAVSAAVCSGVIPACICWDTSPSSFGGDTA